MLFRSKICLAYATQPSSVKLGQKWFALKLILFLFQIVEPLREKIRDLEKRYVHIFLVVVLPLKKCLRCMTGNIGV